MKCKKCKRSAVLTNPSFCRDHFIDYFERTALDTIRHYKLFTKNDRLCVAVSGGKDSMSLLYIINKYFKNVVALAIDEGIAGYRPHTLRHLKRFCTAHNIPLKVLSFKERTGKTLDQWMKKEKHPCSVCGVYRRKLLNEGAKGFDVLALGHNLDDEAQTVLMNLCTFKPDLMHVQLPKSPKSENFVPRVKPFCFLKEKEVLLYAVLLGISPSFVECPYMHEALRNDARDALNAHELERPGSKARLYEAHLEVVQTFLSKDGRGVLHA
ncbi:MAG: tRNA 2-thiocytidine biosynthesis TtcA family protein [Nanoarchaeota archaeon]